MVFWAAVAGAQGPETVANGMFEGIVSTAPAQREQAQAAFEKAEPGLQSLMGAALLNACAQGTTADCPHSPAVFLGEWLTRMAKDSTAALQGDAASKQQAIASIQTVAALLNEAGSAGTATAEEFVKHYQGPSPEALLKKVAEQVKASDPAVRTATVDAMAQLAPLAGDNGVKALRQAAKDASPEVRRQVEELLKSLEALPMDESLRPNPATGE